MDPQSFNVERTEYWKIAQDRLEESDREKKDENDKTKNRWKSLYTEERYAEPSAKWLDATRRKVVQWRMKERVRIAPIHLIQQFYRITKFLKNRGGYCRSDLASLWWRPVTFALQ
jgi:hypothetical protein